MCCKKICWAVGGGIKNLNWSLTPPPFFRTHVCTWFNFVNNKKKTFTILSNVTYIIPRANFFIETQPPEKMIWIYKTSFVCFALIFVFALFFFLCLIAYVLLFILMFYWLWIVSKYCKMVFERQLLTIPFSCQSNGLSNIKMHDISDKKSNRWKQALFNYSIILWFK